MRVVSMVPSWTESLVEAGVNVVGRTQFCIHPKNQVESIPIVGGTKNWSLKKLSALKPDFLLLDKEENPKFMAEQTAIPIITTHIQHVEDVPKSLKELSIKLNNSSLLEMSDQWNTLIQQSPFQLKTKYPGVIEWGRKPEAEIKKIIYVIWRKPWMLASGDTFIGSMLSLCGYQKALGVYESKYPEIQLEKIPDKETTLLLFSSEPYPFLNKREGLEELGSPYAFVDGESFSWFGVRSLEFLKNNLKNSV